MKIFKKAKRGFTLVELVVVIAVIAILAAVSVGAYFGVTESANNSRLEQETKQIHTAIKTVALAGNSNHTLTADGLSVDDLDLFADKLSESIGTDVSVLRETHSTISVPTIVLHEAEFTKEAANDNDKIYKSFDYLNPEIADRKVNTHAVTGEFKIIKEGFTVDKNANPVTHQDIYIDAPGNTTGVKVYLWNDNTSNGDGQDMEVVSKTLDLFKISVPSYYTHVKFESTSDTGAWGDMELVLNEETPCFTTTSRNEGSWTAVPEIPTDYNVKDLTVYFTNNFADGCFIWAWSIDGINNAEKFPGVDITSSKNEFNLYSYTFERDFLSFKLCSDDKGANESAEITLAGASEQTPYYNGNTWVEYPTEAVEKPAPEVKTVYYANKTWDMTNRTMKAYSWVNLAGGAKTENAAFPGVAMEASDVADIYKLDIPMVCDNIIFTNKNSSDDSNGKQTSDISFTGYSETNSFWNGVEWTEKPTVAPEKPEIKTTNVYFVNKENWDNVYIHFWGSETTNDSDWPGIKLEKENGLFKYTLNADIDGLLFNNGNGTKTADLSINEEKPYFVCDKKTNDDWQQSYTVSYYTLTINPTPSDATVVISSEGYTQNGNTITVDEFAKIAYSVSKEGFIEKKETISIIEDTILNISLDEMPEEKFTYTLNVTNEGATVKLSATGFEADGNSIAVAKGTSVSYEVKKTGYITRKGTVTVESDMTEEITLGNTLYLVPNSNWTQSSARFAAYFFNNGEVWSSMTKDGNAYKVTLPADKDFVDVIFCRMNPGAAANNWNNKWNQTADLKIPTDGKNCYTVKANTWDNGGGTWSTK